MSTSAPYDKPIERAQRRNGKTPLSKNQKSHRADQHHRRCNEWSECSIEQPSRKEWPDDEKKTHQATISTSGRSALPSLVTEGSGDLLRSAVLKTCARKATIDAASAPAPSAELKEHLQLPAGDVTWTPR
jgi:hypothetical protein